MTGSLLDTIRRIIREELKQVHTAERAVVQEQHPHKDDSDKDNYACTVALRDSGLVLKQVPVATSRLGVASIPAVGDLVLVQFIGGDINAPVITGSLYNDEDRPPTNQDGQAVLHLPLGAQDQEAVHLEITSGDARALTLKLGEGLTVMLQDDDPVVELTVDKGKATLKMDRDGTVTLESRGSLRLIGNEIKVEAKGQLNLKGATVNIN